MSLDTTNAELERVANTPRSLLNPLNIPFVFKWGGVEYTVPAKTAKVFPGYLAVHGAKHLTHFVKDKVEQKFIDQKNDKGQPILGKYVTVQEVEQYAQENLLDVVPVEVAEPMYSEVNMETVLTPQELMGSGDLKKIAKEVASKSKEKNALTAGATKKEKGPDENLHGEEEYTLKTQGAPEATSSLAGDQPLNNVR